jgi:hypothetical protein
MNFYSKSTILRADVLKVGYHGSFNGFTVPFLDAVDPKYAVMSCGHWNDGLGTPPKTFSTYNYGEPSSRTIAALADKIPGNRRQGIVIKAGVAPGKFLDVRVLKNIYATPWDGNITIQASSKGTYNLILHD